MNKVIIAVTMSALLIVPAVFALDLLGIGILDKIALAGSNNVPVAINMDNNNSVLLFEFSANYPSYMTFTGVDPSSRMVNASVVWNTINSTSTAISVIVPGNVSVGSGKIMDAKFNVSSSAVPGIYTLSISDAIFLNIDIQDELPLDLSSGLFTII